MLDWVTTLKAHDNTGLSGRIIEVPNALWPHNDDDEWDPTGKSACKVVGQCMERFQYANGRAAPSHVIEHQGTLFPVKTSALKDFAARQARRAGKSSAK